MSEEMITFSVVETEEEFGYVKGEMYEAAEVDGVWYFINLDKLIALPFTALKSNNEE